MIDPLAAGAEGEAALRERFEPVREYVRTLQETEGPGLPSLAIAVAQRGRIIWEEAVGWADRESQVPATPHTIYGLASVTKSITGVALMVLRERGLLDLDRPINDYLGESPLTVHLGDPAAVTVRRVANHTAGLTTHNRSFPWDGSVPRPPMEETIRRYGHTYSEPGARFDYSNLGYGILDHLITRVSGRSYADFVRDEFFLPLGMRRSAIADGPDFPPELSPHRAAQYAGGRERVPFGGRTDSVGASSGCASAHDLVRFGLALLGTPLPDQRPVLSAESIAEMFRPTTTAWSDDDGYGVGWIVRRAPDGRVWLRAQGGNPMASASLELYPDQGVVVAGAANAGCGRLGWAVQRAGAALVPGLPLPPAADAPWPSRQAGDPPPAFAPPPELQGVWTGAVQTYEGDRALELDLRADGVALASFAGQSPTPIESARVRGVRLTGHFAGDIGTSELRRYPHRLSLELRLRTGSGGQPALSGAVLTLPLPHAPGGPNVAHWAELTRRA